jgi:hypothetical protein
MSIAAAAGKIGDHFARSLERAVRSSDPFEHWLIEDTLPPATCKALVALPSRLFFSAANRARFAAADDVASAFQCRATVREIEELCGVNLRGTSLRIESCLGDDEFCAESHADIGAKRFTMLIRLSEGQVGSGIIFVPASGTARKLDYRHTAGVQRALLVEYVTPDWGAPDELCYPETPVG